MNISDAEAVDMIVALDKACGDTTSPDEAMGIWLAMDAGMRRETIALHQNLCVRTLH